MKDGLGLLEFADKSIYKGEFRASMKHGRGVMKFAE